MRDDEPNPNKFFKWVVEIEVNETWVADGFEIDADMIQEMIQERIGYSYEQETRARIVKAPDPRAIRVAQGYEDEVPA